ncbi:hypothetical protein [Alteromonas macleodii]|uniref:hypothetical protein n=1 Tax=Alteromonas macleodii TaxID=28108 RepID=UPI001E374CF6|nr:hypothetical protein [Alteromonas macleodii]
MPHVTAPVIVALRAWENLMDLNKADKEILAILKTVFLTRGVRPLLSDDHLRIWIIRMLFLVSITGLISRIAMGIAGKEVTAEMSLFFNTPIAMFFGILFIHINNESENISIIVFVLTWISLVIGLYV